MFGRILRPGWGKTELNVQRPHLCWAYFHFQRKARDLKLLQCCSSSQCSSGSVQQTKQHSVTVWHNLKSEFERLWTSRLIILQYSAPSAGGCFIFFADLQTDNPLFCQISYWHHTRSGKKEAINDTGTVLSGHNDHIKILISKAPEVIYLKWMAMIIASLKTSKACLGYHWGFMVTFTILKVAWWMLLQSEPPHRNTVDPFNIYMVDGRMIGLFFIPCSYTWNTQIIHTTHNIYVLIKYQV